MKKAEKIQTAIRNFDLLETVLSKDQMLNESAMQSVRGGDGDGGGDIILYPPKPPKELPN